VAFCYPVGSGGDANRGGWRIEQSEVKEGLIGTDPFWRPSPATISVSLTGRWGINEMTDAIVRLIFTKVCGNGGSE